MATKKYNCENCGSETTRFNLARHKKRCSAWSLTCFSFTNCSTKPELKRIVTLPKNTLRERLGLFKNAKHVTKALAAFTYCENMSGGSVEHREVQVLKMFRVTQLMGDVVGTSLREELETCKHLLVDSEIENGRQSVYNNATDNLDPN